ncbi:MAG: transporter substrate-binding domain-containing protein [Prevotella sp.]|jgi:membrane-bound lytic murein transglycosylase F|nr:transporter substrate-binding domain-containing protein [Prevotella sp.]
MKPKVIFAIFAAGLAFFCFCRTEKHAPSPVDFEQIKQSGTLTMITMSSSYSYFLYKDEAMGYDYDLCKDFCNHYGLKLEVKVAENQTRLLEMLQKGEGDLVAFPVAVQNELKDSLIYCGTMRVSHQVLVQRANRGDTIIADVADLIGKEVYVKHNTKYHQRLLNLDNELGNGIIIRDVEKDTVTVEDLIEMVSQGKIPRTVSDDYVARLNRTYYRNINISLPLSFDQRSSWVVRKTSPELAKALNEWTQANGNTATYNSITKKYFELSKQPFDAEYVIPKNLPKGSISVFDPLFKKYASEPTFEWYLLAAIAYQESRFHTDLSSWAGATGLMGLMPRTAESLGISSEDRTNPELSIMASVKLLKKLDRLFAAIADNDERLKFVLASYNGGNGHICDARALAEKYGENPDSWEVVERYVQLKSNPEYYNDPVCKNGYFRGTETVNYVRQVIANRNKFKGEKES